MDGKKGTNQQGVFFPLVSWFSARRDAGVTATANKESYHDNFERLPRQSAGCKHDNGHDKNSLYGSTAL